MAQILFLTKEAPLPLQANGATLRINPMVRHLGRHHDVDLVLVNEVRPDADDLLEEAGGFCRSVRRLPHPRLGKMSRLRRTARGLLDPARPPWEMMDPLSGVRGEALGEVLSERSYDAVFAVDGVFDLVARLRRAGRLPQRLVIDWIDAPSLARERFAQKWSGTKAKIAHSRIRRIQAWQRRMNQLVDAAIYIADMDRTHSGCCDLPNVHVVPNGVLRREGTFERPDGTPPTIGFLGNMSYGPNVDAALRLHDRIFRPLAETHPDLRLKVIGRTPAPPVLDLAGPRVEITGEVDSIWPHLAEVDVMVFPMNLGGGLQNKVLEAVEARCAVVVTHVGAAGLGERHLNDLVIRETDEEFRQTVAELLDDPEALAQAQERSAKIRDAFDWSAILPRFEEIVTGVPQPSGGT